MFKQNKQTLGTTLLRTLQGFTSEHTHVSDTSKLVSLVANDAQDEFLKAENILLAEFKFASAYILQISQDRTNTLNLYFLFIGVLTTGGGLIYQGARAYLPWIVFLVLTALGIAHEFFYGRLALLEAQHSTYVERMNGIRNFYVLQFSKKLPNIAGILRTIPGAKTFKGYFFVFHTTTALALIGSICFAGAAFVLTGIWANLYHGDLLFPTYDIRPYIIGIIICVISFCLSYGTVQNRHRSV